MTRGNAPSSPAVHGPARLNLREHLALVRSILSNERTFLAYQRTALTQLALAVTFIHFFDHPAFTIIGWLLIPTSFLTIGMGVLRYRRIRALVRAMEAATRKARTEAVSEASFGASSDTSSNAAPGTPPGE